MPDDRILVGVLGAPHGVRGELRLKSYTQDPLAIVDYSPLEDPSGRRKFVVVAARPVKDDMLVVRLEGVEDRDAAAALTNTRLFVPRDRLPPPDDEDEFYHADLIGLSVETVEGEKIGTIQAVLDFGAGEILEIRPSDGARAFMLPFTKDVVPNVDVKNGRMIVTIPAEVEGNPEVSGNGETSD
jgi:16S rRNA processing protein RimM